MSAAAFVVVKTYLGRTTRLRAAPRGVNRRASDGSCLTNFLSVAFLDGRERRRGDWPLPAFRKRPGCLNSLLPIVLRIGLLPDSSPRPDCDRIRPGNAIRAALAALKNRAQRSANESFVAVGTEEAALVGNGQGDDVTE